VIYRSRVGLESGIDLIWVNYMVSPVQVYISKNSGSSWTSTTLAIYCSLVACSGNTGKYVVCVQTTGTKASLYLSTNWGASFVAENGGTKVDDDIEQCDNLRSNLLVF
jgi:hypothetical protein